MTIISPFLIWVLMFVPFVLVAIPMGIAYLKKGYKEGLKHSTYSICATLLSVVGALILSKIIAPIISWLIFKLIPASLFEEAGALASLIASIGQGIAGVILSFLFFVIFFIVAICVSKKLIHKIKIEKFVDDPTKKSSKWFGLGIRTVDAIVVSLLLLLPIYGTVAYTVPVISKAYKVVNPTATVQQDRTLSYLDCVETHPMVVINKNGPVAWVFESLSKLNVNGAGINLAEISEVIEEAINLYNEGLEAKTEKEQMDVAKKMNDLLRKTVVEKDWLYDVVNMLVGEVKEALKTEPDTEETQIIKEILPYFELTREQFKTNATALVEFSTLSLNEGFLDCLRNNEFHTLSDDYFDEMGKLINLSDQAVAIKKLMVMGGISDLYMNEYYDSLDDDDYSQEEYEQASKVAQGKSITLMDKYWGDGYVDAKDQRREAYSILMFAFGSGDGDRLEALARHPKFGAEVAQQFVNANVVMDSVYFDDEKLEDKKYDFYNNNAVKKAVKKLLKDCETTRLTSFNVDKGLSLIGNTIHFLKEPNPESYYIGNYYVPINRQAVNLLVDSVGKNYFYNSQPHGKEVYELLKALQTDDSMFKKYANQTANLSLFADLVDFAKSDWKNVEFDNVFTLNYLLDDTITCKTIESLMAKKGNDPFGFGKKLTTGQKDLLGKHIDGLAEHTYTSDYTFSADGLESIFDGDSTMTSDGLLTLKDGMSFSNSTIIKGNGGSGTVQVDPDALSDFNIKEIPEQLKKEMKANADIIKRFFGIT